MNATFCAWRVAKQPSKRSPVSWSAKASISPTLARLAPLPAARLAYSNAETRKYEEREFAEQLEIVSFQGNSSLKDGKPFLHIHGVFARRDFSTIGGHIKELRVHPTLELWLRTEDGAVRRVHEPETGLDLLDLPEQ